MNTAEGRILSEAEVARLANCTPVTVRKFREDGIIAPVATTAAGVRLYECRAVEIVVARLAVKFPARFIAAGYPAAVGAQ